MLDLRSTLYGIKMSFDKLLNSLISSVLNHRLLSICIRFKLTVDLLKN